MQNIFKAALLVLVIVFWTGCGGVTEEEGSSSGGVSGTLDVDCSGIHCGSSGNTYTGSGIGVWRYKNGGSRAATLNVSLSNIANKDIMIVFTNEGNSRVNLPYIYVNSTLHNLYNEMNIQSDNDDYIDTFNHIPDTVREFNARNFALKKSESNQNINYNQLSAKTVGDWNVWNIVNRYDQNEQRNATLRHQQTVSGGRTVNIWVENSEYRSDRISSATVNEIAQYLNIIVNSVTSVAGEPWGTYDAELNELLIPASQPLNIVFVNYDQNGYALGVLGYFYALNNFLNGNGVSNSNEALAVFVDTETIYLHSEGKKHIISTIAHELTHAVVFYKRGIVMNDYFDTFLNEMSAIMMEDIVAKKLDSTFNDVKFRYIDWHEETSYNNDFANWCTPDNNWCFGGDQSYDIAGSFGAYLLRQHGIAFYKELFATRSSSGSDLHARSLNILDKAIRTYNSSGLGRALQRWGASIAMFPADANLTGFGYPARNNDNGFNFEAFNGNDYKQYRALPTYSPASLAAHGHFPFLRKETNNIYATELTVPAGVSVSIVVK
jgi:hypothetical protein